MGPVVGKDEVEAGNHGIIDLIIQVSEAKTLKGKTPREEGVVIEVDGRFLTSLIEKWWRRSQVRLRL